MPVAGSGVLQVAHLYKDLVVLSVELYDFLGEPRSKPRRRCNNGGEKVGVLNSALGRIDNDWGIGRVELKVERCRKVACLGGRCYAPSREGGSDSRAGRGAVRHRRAPLLKASNAARTASEL